MALSTTVQPEKRHNLQAQLSHPIGIQADWMWVCNAPATADNAGNEVTAPLAISRAALRRIRPAGCGTTMLLCLRYSAAATVSTSPVVQPFGFDKPAGSADTTIPHRLRDADGIHALTLAAAATDVSDGTYKYTDPVEVDMDGSYEILVAIKTALAVSAGSTAGAEVLVKFK